MEMEPFAECTTESLIEDLALDTMSQFLDDLHVEEKIIIYPVCPERMDILEFDHEAKTRARDSRSITLK